MTEDPERQGVLWTPEEESCLRRAHSQGLSVQRAARHLCRTVDATKQMATRLDVEHPRFGP